MTLQDLKKKVKVVPFGLVGKIFDVEIKYRGKKYKCESPNKDAYCAIVEHAKPNSAESVIFKYTEKSAYQYFYDECCKRNHLK